MSSIYMHSAICDNAYVRCNYITWPFRTFDQAWECHIDNHLWKMADLVLTCLQQCEDLLSNFCHEIQRPGALQNTLEGLLLSAEVVLTYCVLLAPLILDLPEAATDSAIHTIMNIALDSVRDVTEMLEAILEAHERCPSTRSCTREKGRPKLHITEGQVLELLDAQFSFSDIARLLGCSYKTICRRQQEFGIREARWTPVSDNELDIVVTKFIDEHPILAKEC